MHTTTRRRFLKQAALAGAACALPGLSTGVLAAAPVRVRGHVVSRGRGVAGVGVTDGLQTVRTDGDGAFELITSSRRPFVYLTLPAGHRIPRHPTGTARLYRPLRPDARGEQQVRFELEPLPDGDERHAFVVLADPQTQNAYEMGRFHAETVPSVQATLAALDGRAAFGVACGDIMFDDLSLFPEYERAVERMGAPFFQVVGNHDLDFDGLTDPASTRTFERHFGPTYYAFDRGAVHYVVLDDVFWQGEDYFGYLDADQLAWLEQDLAHVEAGRPVVVFQHIPALSTRYRRTGGEEAGSRGAVTNRALLYDLLAPYDAHIVSGHTHENEHVFEAGVHEHVLGTACGAWWSGPICYDGTPSGYAVFEADGATLRWHYQSTGRPADHQLRVYPRGSVPGFDRDVVANVWDWDPEWTVVWYEGGDRRGALTRRTALDPLSVALHEGPEKPDRRPWVDPIPTDHLFFAAVPDDARDVVVEATDRFGRTYAAAVTDDVLTAVGP